MILTATMILMRCNQQQYRGIDFLEILNFKNSGLAHRLGLGLSKVLVPNHGPSKNLEVPRFVKLRTEAAKAHSDGLRA